MLMLLLYVGGNLTEKEELSGACASRNEHAAAFQRR
jgi:hypothetical protein